jgi:hypothetical protein
MTSLRCGGDVSGVARADMYDLMENTDGLYLKGGFAKGNTITNCCVLKMWKT